MATGRMPAPLLRSCTRMLVDEVRRLGVDLFLLLDDLAIVHAGDAVGIGEDTVVVGDDDHGALRRAGDIAEEFEHDFAIVRVESGGGFVADDERRFVNQRAGDGDTLLLAAGEFVRLFLPADRSGRVPECRCNPGSRYGRTEPGLC